MINFNLSSTDEADYNKKDLISLFILFSITYLFLLFLNIIFPPQSDDLSRKFIGLKGAIESYKTWNGRFGELLSIISGTSFAQSIPFSLINSFLGTSLIFLIFLNITGYLPNKSLKSLTLYSVLILFLLIDPGLSFGSIFYWACGSFNYLWTWFFLLLIITPCTLFWRKIEFSKKLNLIIFLLGIPFGIFAGWSSEFGIVIIVLWLTTIIYSKIKKIKLPLWYYTTLISLILGWVILYFSPGTHTRANQAENYVSLIQIIKSGPIGIIKRILFCFDDFSRAFYYLNICFISFFILLTTIFNKPSTKKIIYSICEILLMGVSLFIFPRFFYIPCALTICIINAIKLKKDIPFLFNLFVMLSGILIASFFFIGATIQVGIPRRAKLQCTILNFGIIAATILFCFEIFKDNIKIQKLATSVCLILTLFTMTFVCVECIHMNNKWHRMEQSIAEQKANGNIEIIIDKTTFNSKYWSYGDWGNPKEDPNIWPNTAYAEHYKVKSFIAK